MKKLTLTLIVVLFTTLMGNSQVSLEYCLEHARQNYPLIKKYSLVSQTTDLQLSDINKSWLPRIGVYGQATLQNIVPEFPETLKDVLSQFVHDMKGLGHLQYKAGVDLTQTVWDGGATASQRKIERATASETEASLGVQMYAIREKVMNLYFGILLMDEQIAQTENTISLLQANKTLMESMLKGGVAMQCDVDMVEAQMLSMKQQLVTARNAAEDYRKLLSLYVGENLAGKKFDRPDGSIPADFRSERPELSLFDARNRVNLARRTAIESTLMPKIGFFAQAYYGYPGINYFESMLNRNLSFNIVAGVKISWNIDSFYTRKNARRKLDVSDQDIENDREIFLFNSRIQTQSQIDAIDGMREVMKEDERIVKLRRDVRRAAESQLENGVIDATALLTKITDENQARLTSSYHEIQLLQNIYKLKYTLNR